MTDKQRRGTVIEARAREMVLSVTKYFEDERNSCKDLLQAFSKLVQNEETVSPCEVKVPVKLLTDVVQLLRATTRVTERVVAATNINKNTLTKIRREGEEARSNNTSIQTPVKRPRGKKNFFGHIELQNFKTIIHTNFIKRNEIFKLSTILHIARNEFNYQGSKATLRRIVSDLGFQLVRSQGKPVLTVCNKLDKEHSDDTKTGTFIISNTMLIF